VIPCASSAPIFPLRLFQVQHNAASSMSSLFMSHFSHDIACILSRDGTSYTGTNRNRRQCLPKFFFNDHGADQLSTLPYINPSHSHRGVASDMGEIYVTQARLSLFITGSLHAAAPLLHLQSCFYTRGAARQGMLHDCCAMLRRGGVGFEVYQCIVSPVAPFSSSRCALS
jgi:hypothetical protein